MIEIKKYSRQYGGLMKSYKKMKGKMDKMADLHGRYDYDLEQEEKKYESSYTNEESGMLNYQYKNISELFDKQIDEM